MQEAADADTMLRRRLEAEYSSRPEESPSSENPGQPKPTEPSATGAGLEEPETPETSPASPSAVPALAPVKINAGSGSKTEASPSTSSISDSYPLPIAYSWSLLAGLWDPRDRYREQLRHAENMLAFVGSVSIALL